ncbi:ABC transporter ATP-binding protein [Aquisphaera insulae]|uniref:ABC transporter ATP-binding protein n=1 Tax=Aquisphaera insulae TaxID=2712864 RepID=UPI00202E652B|nr:ABC transporter transmembrane domain-containing protein [Aquisphaera insulae]
MLRECMEAHRANLSAVPVDMKNFVRLVKFAWPHRFRIAASIAAAVMVALFYFTELGAVLPLLTILFKSETPQRWVTSKVHTIESRLVLLDAQADEAERVARAAELGEAEIAKLPSYFKQLTNESDEIENKLRLSQRAVDLPALAGLSRAEIDAQEAAVEDLRLQLEVVEGRINELNHGSKALREGDWAAIRYRVQKIAKDRAGEKTWLARYQRLKPFICEYLPSDSFRSLVLLIGLLIVGVAIKGFFMFIQEVLVANVMQRTQFDIRNLFFRRTLALDLGSFSSQGSAELMARFTNDMDSFGQGLVTLLSKLSREPLRVLFCLGGALYLNWRLTCLTLVVVPISALVTVRVGRTMKRAMRRSLESMSSIYKILQESFQGIRVVKAFAMERPERRRFFVETKNFYRKAMRVAMIDAMSDPVLEMLTLITVAIALLAGSYLVLNKTIYLPIGPFNIQLAGQVMAIEELLTLYTMLAGASDPIRKLSNVHSKIQRAAAASDRICALMDREPQVVERPAAIDLPRHEESIEFDDVRFHYEGRPPLLKGIHLKVQHGETVALVGPNGCGKTTLMNLLPRFWDVESGTIRVDGQDVKDVRIRSFRRQIGIVPQETILFQDTIARNIAYGDPGASREAIIEAAKRSYAHQFIMQLPQGYDTLIGERGHGLSGGQRQRIALARAMLRNPTILILDEATSAVDIQDEALIRKAIEEFSKGRTTFLISHSLGTIQCADRIILIDDGKIVAQGTDQELRRTSPLYRKLYEIHYHRESA